jgi:hypothetical protein
MNRGCRISLCTLRPHSGTPRVYAPQKVPAKTEPTLLFSIVCVIRILWWPGTGLNRRRRPFQGRALPLSYLASGKTFVAFSCAGFRRAPKRKATNRALQQPCQYINSSPTRQTSGLLPAGAGKESANAERRTSNQSKTSHSIYSSTSACRGAPFGPTAGGLLWEDS